MKKSAKTVIFLFILYLVVDALVVLIQFTYRNMNIFVNIAFNISSLALLVYIIDKMVKKIDKK